MGAPDVLYKYPDLKPLISRDFQKESDLCDFLEFNLEEFCVEIYGSRPISYEREYSVSGAPKRRKHSRRIDFFVRLEDHRIVGLECKQPRYISELSNCIGQCLTYIMMSQQAEKIQSVCIVSSVIDHVLPSVLEEFDLPIDFVVINKSKLAKWVRQ